ncbi:unannotated protein [freshwater metagenome]|uniref:Unannotated protein n=1 Tax=freshwater metagenome TaxID=449393 RepID=A0A6J7XUR5_9ZZZZ|nr:HIT domain-containing protein [Actinomycetota bacterium]
MSLDSNCLFCKIIIGDIPAEIIFRNEKVVAFKDINPQAPVHILFIPTIHTPTIAGLASISSEMTAALFLAAAEVATAHGVEDYRTVFNTGEGAGQSVFHAHMHLLGGRGLAWPPG